MRKEVVAAVTGLALLGGLVGCAPGGVFGPTAAAVVPTPRAPMGPFDPDEPKFVAYHDYRDAARRMSLPSDRLVSAAQFRQSLWALSRPGLRSPAATRPHCRWSWPARIG
jgi:hypothetical protein